MKLKHLAVLLALSTMAADCPFGDKDTTGPGDTNIFGTYTLQKINGANLPANWNDVWDDGSVHPVQVTAGQITINSGGTFTYSETRASGNESISGTWSVEGSTYTFIPSDAEGPDEYGIGTFSGTQFTLSVEGGETIRIYQKSGG